MHGAEASPIMNPVLGAEASECSIYGSSCLAGAPDRSLLNQKTLRLTKTCFI